jgi:hypothetical protein
VSFLNFSFVVLQEILFRRSLCNNPLGSVGQWIGVQKPEFVSVDDFFMAPNLDKPRDTTASKVGSNVTLINAMKIPNLNMLGISIVRIDYTPQPRSRHTQTPSCLLGYDAKKQKTNIAKQTRMPKIYLLVML